MKRAREIEAANARLGNEGGGNRLESLLVDRFYRVYQAHATEHRDELIFSYHLGYPFVNYTFAPDNENEAKQLFVKHFDHHATLQEENYLVQHEASKRHGKLKGKHLRLALNWANLQSAFAGVEPTAWPTQIPASAMQAAELLGRYCEGVTDTIYEFLDRSRPAPDQQVPGAAPKEERGQVGRMQRLLHMTLEQLLQQYPAAANPHLQGFLCLLLKMQTVWLDSTLLRSHCFVRDSLPQGSAEAKAQLVMVGLAMLAKLQLATAALSTNINGPRKLLAVKRSVPRDHPHYPSLRAFLAFFDVPEQEYRAPEAEEITVSPPNAAPIIAFPDFEPAAAATALAALRTWAAAAPAA